MTAQNIYDDPVFFAGYAALPRSLLGLDAVFEWPSFRRLLPVSVTGLRVLDLGCGMGYMARDLRARGAASVLGVDLSERMLNEARRGGGDPAIAWLRADLASFAPPPASFDLIVSSLALHYIADYSALVKRAAIGLARGGRFVFSVEHPIFTANEPSDWHIGEDGTKAHWPVDRYQEQGERRTRWFTDGVVKYHRTVETYIAGLLAHGLTLTGIAEPVANPEQLADRPEWREEVRRPPFLLLAADRLDSVRPGA